MTSGLVATETGGHDLQCDFCVAVSLFGLVESVRMDRWVAFSMLFALAFVQLCSAGVSPYRKHSSAMAEKRLVSLRKGMDVAMRPTLCKDIDDFHCANWAAMGWCSTKPLIRSHCRNSCGLCDKDKPTEAYFAPTDKQNCTACPHEAISHAVIRMDRHAKTICGIEGIFESEILPWTSNLHYADLFEENNCRVERPLGLAFIKMLDDGVVVQAYGDEVSDTFITSLDLELSLTSALKHDKTAKSVTKKGGFWHWLKSLFTKEKEEKKNKVVKEKKEKVKKSDFCKRSSKEIHVQYPCTTEAMNCGEPVYLIARIGTCSYKR